MGEGLGLASLRNFVCPGNIDIDHTDQFRFFHVGILFCMELAQITDTHHAHPNLAHLTADPPLRMLDEMEKVLNLWRLGNLILPDFLYCFLQCQSGAENDAIGLLQTLHGLL